MFQVLAFILTAIFSINYDCICFGDSDTDKKSSVDQAFRDVLLHLVVSSALSCMIHIYYE